MSVLSTLAHTYSIFIGQKWALDPLKLELQTVLSHYMGAGNWASARAASALNC